MKETYVRSRLIYKLSRALMWSIRAKRTLKDQLRRYLMLNIKTLTLRFLKLTVLLFVSLSALNTSRAQDRNALLAEAKQLNQQVEELYLQGQVIEAMDLAKRALYLREKLLGVFHPDVAESLNNLALLHQAQGDYVRAELMFLRALAIREKAKTDIKAESEIAIVLNNLAILYVAKENYRRAESLLLRALVIDERIHGADHADLAPDVNNLAAVYAELGQLQRAEMFFQRALKIYEKKFGSQHAVVAMALNNLGVVYHLQGEYSRAETFFLRALAIREKVLGADHPGVAGTLNNLAILHQAQGNMTQALLYKARVEEARERNLNLVLAAGSENDKQRYLDLLKGEASGMISLHLRDAPGNSSAQRLALTTILRRKGRALDVMSDQISVLRQRTSPAERAPLDQLAAVRTKIATLILSGQGKDPDLKVLEDEAERLEGEVSQKSAEFKTVNQPVTLERILSALPADAALVEIASYRPFNPRAKSRRAKYGTPRYAAYVLKPNGEISFADLGDAVSLDALAANFRSALKSPNSTERRVKQQARILDERLMRPIRELLGSIKRVFLCPDGALNLIPFEALVNESSSYLLEDYSFNYLTSGRDLLRLQLSVPSESDAVIIANPQFDTAKSIVTCGTGLRGLNLKLRKTNATYRDSDFAALCYPTLEGTAREATDLGALLPRGQLWTRKEATETNLKAVRRPRILHIATHGFFLPDQNEARSEARSAFGGIANTMNSLSRANPLLRSGLILAGVNQGQSGTNNDGVFTALEGAGLDLFGTKLVVLSACETALGDTLNGQGIYGLRRALVLAGSQTQVMSLWKVSDAGTHDLMVAYYTRLQRGEGRAEALRQVQLMMLHGQLMPSRYSDKRGTTDPVNLTLTSYRHPYYWAAFIRSGDWRTMDSK